MNISPKNSQPQAEDPASTKSGVDLSNSTIGASDDGNRPQRAGLQQTPYSERFNKFKDAIIGLTYKGDVESFAQLYSRAKELIREDEGFSSQGMWEQMYVLSRAEIAIGRLLEFQDSLPGHNLTKEGLTSDREHFYAIAETVAKSAGRGCSYSRLHFQRVKGLVTQKLAFKPEEVLKSQNCTSPPGSGAEGEWHQYEGVSDALQNLARSLHAMCCRNKFDTAVLICNGKVVPVSSSASSGQMESVFYNVNTGCPEAVELTSLTKVFTACIAFKMVQDGLLKLDEKVCDIMPYWQHWKTGWLSEITVRDILTHQSGIPRDRPEDLRSVGAANSAGTGVEFGCLREGCPGLQSIYSSKDESLRRGRFKYSNLAVNFLAHIFEEKLKQTTSLLAKKDSDGAIPPNQTGYLDCYIKNVILKPLGMKVEMSQHNEGLPLLASNMCTTLLDLARYAESIRLALSGRENQILNNNSVKEMLGLTGEPHLWSLEEYCSGPKKWQILKGLGSLDNDLYMVPDAGLIWIMAKEIGPDRALQPGESGLPDTEALRVIKDYLTQFGVLLEGE